MRTLATEWVEYERALLDPIGAGAVQRGECRKAFYAGAATMRNVMLLQLSAGAEVTGEDLQLVAAVELELKEFGLGVAK
jgi:hypothetical protein